MNCTILEAGLSHKYELVVSVNRLRTLQHRHRLAGDNVQKMPTHLLWSRYEMSPQVRAFE